MIGRPLLVLLAGAVLGAPLSGCGGRAWPGLGGATPRVGALAPAAETRDELLLAAGDAVWRGDLAAAHIVLSRLADREQGVRDTALDFWSELLALLRCEPLPTPPVADSAGARLRDPWERLRRLVQIERVRLTRSEIAPAPKPASLVSRQPGASDRHEIAWPVERERWTDELAFPAAEDRCVAAVAVDVATGRNGARALPGAAEAGLVQGFARTLPSDHPAAPALLTQAAVVAIARGEAAEARPAVQRLDALAPRLEAELTAGERGSVRVAAALATIADRAAPPEEVLARGSAGIAAAPRLELRRALQIMVAARLNRAGRKEEASAILGPPPHGDDEAGRYIAFRQVQAHARAKRHAQLLAEAREALHNHSAEQVAADATLAAVMDIALRTLLASPVSVETLELLESLGPPRERLQRAADFARIALERGAFQSASATFLWLHANDTDPSQQLQYLARASVAAARAGDPAEFARTFRLLAGQEEQDPGPPERGARPEGAPSAGALRKTPAPAGVTRGGGMVASAEAERGREKRREARSVNWQRALLVVARDALAALVEADDQANLATLVATLKRHLGDGGRGPVDEELTTLYRAASAHLRTGARAYAETVGAERRPILLGEVRLDRSYPVRAPHFDEAVPLAEVGPLVFVPRRGNDPAPASLRRWPARFGVAWTGGGS